MEGSRSLARHPHVRAPWLSGRWAHPAIGYLVAVLLQIIVVTCLVALIRLFPSFQFQEAVLILNMLVVAITWGVGPSLLATLWGGVLLLFLFLPPAFTLSARQPAQQRAQIQPRGRPHPGDAP